MDVKLIVVGGKHPGQEIPVPGPKFFIGRSEDCQLRPRSDMVSRNHCVILMEEGFVAVRDFGSKNGTFVNGERVKTERELKAGDRLKVGPLEFEVQLGVSISGKKKPKVHNVHEAAARTVESAHNSDKDLDITGWLSEENEETVSGSISPDTISVPGSRPGAPAKVTPTSETAAKASGETTHERIDPMLAPQQTVKKPAATSSRSAAADMLKQFMQRRP